MSVSFENDFIKFESGWNKGIDFNNEALEFEKVLDLSTKENDVQSYIKSNKKWFIPASIFENYDFGHHEAYIAPECPLGDKYRTDYVLLGKNSAGYHLVFVEFEDVNVDYKQKNSNDETLSVRKGLTQIRDWKRWIDSYKDYFLSSTNLSSKVGMMFSWGFCYCLVVSRRKYMNVEANALRNQYEHENLGVKIITYDRLVDNIKRLHNGF